MKSILFFVILIIFLSVFYSVSFGAEYAMDKEATCSGSPLGI